MVNDDGVFCACRDTGLVNEIYSADRLNSLGCGNIAIGHVRYATTGADSKRNIQPLLINHRKGRMALAHNGNLTNSYELRNALEERGSIFHTTTDSEVIAYMIVQERLRHGSIEEAVSAAMDTLEGAYSLVISSPAQLIAATRLSKSKMSQIVLMGRLMVICVQLSSGRFSLTVDVATMSPL